METNPYESPNADASADADNARSMSCPECGERMEPGYVTTGARMYWRGWGDTSWFVSYLNGLPGTRPAFVGSIKLSGYRCATCELIVFRYGTQKSSFAPENRR